MKDMQVYIMVAIFVTFVLILALVAILVLKKYAKKI